MSVYGTSVVKRLSKSQARELDRQLHAIAEQEKPTSVRGTRGRMRSHYHGYVGSERALGHASIRKTAQSWKNGKAWR